MHEIMILHSSRIIPFSHSLSYPRQQTLRVICECRSHVSFETLVPFSFVPSVLPEKISDGTEKIFGQRWRMVLLKDAFQVIVLYRFMLVIDQRETKIFVLGQKRGSDIASPSSWKQKNVGPSRKSCCETLQNGERYDRNEQETLK